MPVFTFPADMLHELTTGIWISIEHRDPHPPLIRAEIYRWPIDLQSLVFGMPEAQLLTLLEYNIEPLIVRQLPRPFPPECDCS